MKNGMTKKDYELVELKIVDLFITTSLNRREIAEIVGMSGSEVGTVISNHHAVKDSNEDGKLRRPEGWTPCMLTLSAWPRCYGQGCYWAREDRNSECQAYLAMQNSMAS